MSSIKHFAKILVASILCTACGDELPKKKSTPDGGKKTPVTGSQDAKKTTPPTAVKLTGPLPLFKLEEGISSENKKFLVKLDWLKGPSVKNNDQLKLTFAKLDLQKPAKVVITKLVFVNCCSEEFVYNTVTTSENFNVYIVSNINFKAANYEFRVEATVDGIPDSISKNLGAIK